MNPGLKNPGPGSELVEEIRSTLSSPGEVWLVGGAVRDSLLERPFRDVDLAVASGGLELARYLADHLGGAYYPLDESRGCGRVILRRAAGRLVIDVAELRGKDLLEDLGARDFTINAMAVELNEPGTIVDPEGGRTDLEKRVVRALSRRSLEDDPLRSLRAVRLAAELDFSIQSETESWARESVKKLRLVSPERIRDELTRITLAPQRANSLRRLWSFGALEVVLPELATLHGCVQGPPHRHDVWDHTLAAVDELEAVSEALAADQGDLRNERSEGLEVHRDALLSRLGEEWVVDRPRLSLLFLATLLHDIGKGQTRAVDEDGRVRFRGHEARGSEVARNRLVALRFSRRECDWVARVVRHHLRPLWLSTSPPISDRARHRFYRVATDAAPETCLLSLADNRAKGLAGKRWRALVSGVSRLLEGYLVLYSQLVEPPPLVRGTDVLERTGGEPGPWVGSVLEAISEAQAAGEVTTREEALALVSGLVQVHHQRRDR